MIHSFNNTFSAYTPILEAGDTTMMLLPGSRTVPLLSQGVQQKALGLIGSSQNP